MTGPSYDVVVIGLGTAGAEAFRAAVGAGLRVLGIERCNGMGGQGTLGCVSFKDSITDRLRDLERDSVRGEVAYESTAIGARLEKGRVTQVSYVANGIVRDVSATVVIDASGNATVARLCGLGVRKGRDFDGVMAPCSRAETWMDAKGKVHPIYRNHPEDLSLSPEAYSGTVSMLARERHGFWKAKHRTERMLRPASLVGAREEPRYFTEEILTLDDALRGRTYPDPIFHAWEPEDLPVFHGDHAFESEAIQNWKVLCGLPFFAYPATLSYGTIVAKGVDNLLVPSKHFGVSHDLGGGIRMQEEMRKGGLVAACAATVMVRTGCAAREVPYAELKPLLERADTLRPPRKAFVTSYHGFEFKPFTDAETVAALRQDVVRTGEWWYARSKGASCERAAYAFWTAWSRDLTGTDAERRALADLLAAELAKTPRYAGNFAVALGLLRDVRTVPVLRNIVAHPGGATDPVIPKAYPNRIKAILLLGRFADAASRDTLLEIVRDDAKTFTADLVGAGAFRTADLCRFQTLSYALMALRAILAVHPDAKTEEVLRAWLAKPMSYAGEDGLELAGRLKMAGAKIARPASHRAKLRNSLSSATKKGTDR